MPAQYSTHLAVCVRSGTSRVWICKIKTKRDVLAEWRMGGWELDMPTEEHNKQNTKKHAHNLRWQIKS